MDEEKMATHRMKLDFNHLIALIDETLSAESIDDVQKNAFGIGVGLTLLLGYMKRLAEHAINTDDEFILEWCKGLMIVKEDDGGIS